MRIAILHYHFDRGGVTRVVESTLAAFANRPEFRFGLLSGRPVTGILAPAVVLPDLNYTSGLERLPNPETLFREILAAARTLFDGEEPDLWHIHNPALGKNSAMTGVVRRLAGEGRSVLLHEHDFAEDFRPANYRHRETHRPPEDPVFPFSEKIHWAVLNGRDHRLLTEAGLPPHLCHLLPNPVPVSSSGSPGNPESNLILYPVRALARKNLGEFLLLSHLLREDFRFESTLPPTNSSYLPQFEQWKALADDLSLPVRLGSAAKDDLTFSDRMERCKAVITTSVAEGFGLGFLEPWTFNRPVIGRNLPEITDSFRHSGVQLNHLYQEFPIPKSAFGSNASASWLEGLQCALREFSVSPDPDHVQMALERLFGGSTLDFSLLGENDQEEAIRRIVAERIPVPLPFEADNMPGQAAISASAEAVTKSFNPSHYADRLVSIYTKAVGAPRTRFDPLDPQKILNGFLHPIRFRPHFFSTI